jgi:excisionase family DNA binding protein
MDKLLTARQSADYLGVKLVTMRKWMSQRLIGSTRLGKRAIRIRESELQKFIERGNIPAHPGRSQ